MKNSILAIILLAALFFSFTTGGDSFTIHVNDKQVAEYYLGSRKPLPSVTLTPADKNGYVKVFYSECGQIGKERTLTVKNEDQKILKQWNFPNAVNEHTPMTVSVNDLLELMKKDKITLHYSSRDISRQQQLTTFASSPSTARK